MEWVALFIVAVIVGGLVVGIIGLASGRENWRAAVCFTAIIGALFVGAMILVFIFDAVWAEGRIPRSRRDCSRSRSSS